MAKKREGYTARKSERENETEGDEKKRRQIDDREGQIERERE